MFLTIEAKDLKILFQLFFEYKELFVKYLDIIVYNSR